MSRQMNNIFHETVSIRKGEFRDNSSMIEKLPKQLKERILKYLKEPPPGLVGDVVLRDPVSGVVFDTTSVIRERDGYEWSTYEIHMLEHHDARLSEEFLRLFQ